MNIVNKINKQIKNDLNNDSINNNLIIKVIMNKVHCALEHADFMEYFLKLN